jgi:hypothetical protein
MLGMQKVKTQGRTPFFSLQKKENALIAISAQEPLPVKTVARFEENASSTNHSTSAGASLQNGLQKSSSTTATCSMIYSK